MTADADQKKKTLLLFDVDGTLTAPRLSVTPEMLALLERVKHEYASEVELGIVGGSDFAKQAEQLAPANILDLFHYVFSENGLVAYRTGILLAKQSLTKHLGELNFKRLVNFLLRLLSETDCPVKRGTFIEFRNGMLNVSPIGRQCTQDEREQFEAYDKEHNVRVGMVEKLEREFADLKMKFVIGGQISMDVFPEGWDKTYCLRFVTDLFGDIHFFGDKTSPGGNDYEIYVSERTVGHSVKTFEDTMRILNEMYPPKSSQ